MPSTLLSFITIAVYSCTLCQAPPPLNPFAGEGGVGHTFAQGPGPFYNGIGLPIEYGNLAPGHHLNNVVPRFPVEDFPEHLAPSPSQAPHNYYYNRDREDPDGFRRSHYTPGQSSGNPPRLPFPFQQVPPIHSPQPWIKFGGSHVHPGAPNSIKNAHDHFHGRPSLERVAIEHSSAITTGRRTPLSSETRQTWKRQGESYRALNKDDRQEVNFWLGQWFLNTHPSTEDWNEISAYVWSLQESVRTTSRPTAVWWKQSLIDGNKPNNQFIQLVQIGDRLKFFDPSPALQLNGVEAEEITKDITTILYLGKDRQLRQNALNVEALTKYRDAGSPQVSMYEARVGQLMRHRLRDFDSQNDVEQTRRLRELYLFYGVTSTKADRLSPKALSKKGHKSFGKLFEFQDYDYPGQTIYNNIQTQLFKLAK
ncbi:hypothetical protein PGTUg99_000502 [Puccinia graminis f. sp. tritici]|uniref:Secreted protein n=1 Tax=Puccinia graminis f. sp. tritici TaxID=56615 RepID=A0A5B0QGU2_PUCGR|nr:hypothetical protein PGTUg99_000502 [Puccinia graminis f. sp. tritici]